MTDEQEKQIAEINGLLSDPWRHDTGHFINGCETLMDIIDDLQKQHPKRYTEEELRAEFENQPIDTVCPPPNEPQIVGRGSLYGWIAAFRFLGMIKTEGES